MSYKPPHLRKHIEEGNIKELQKRIYRILQPVRILDENKKYTQKKRQNNNKNMTYNPFLATDDFNIFNLKIGDNTDEDLEESQRDNYIKFLLTVNKSIEKVNSQLISNTGKMVSFFPTEEGIEEPSFMELYYNLFDKKESDDNSSRTSDGYVYPNYFKTMFTNSYLNRLKKTGYIFDKKEDIDVKMKSVLDQRVSSLKTCYEFVHPSNNEEKEKLKFFISEFLREIDDIEKPNKERCRNINWGLKGKNLFETKEIINEQKLKIRKFLDENPDEKKLLGTFLNGIDSEDFEKIIKERKRQYIFGYKDTIDRFGYEDYPLLFEAMGIIYDLFNNCGQYVNWSLLTNLLYDYCALEQTDMLFPIRFLLDRKMNLSYFPDPEDPTKGKYNLNFRFKNKPRYIFDPKLFKFTGVITIKYEFTPPEHSKKKAEKRAFLLFVFKKIFNPKDIDPELFLELRKNYNLDSGLMPEYVILNHTLKFIEYGNIFKNPAITHIEFNHFLTYSNTDVDFYRHKPSISKGVDMLFIRKRNGMVLDQSKIDDMDLEKVKIVKLKGNDDRYLFIKIEPENEIQDGGKGKKNDLYLSLYVNDIYTEFIDKVYNIENTKNYQEVLNKLIHIYPYAFVNVNDFKSQAIFQKKIFNKLLPKYTPITYNFFQNNEVIKSFLQIKTISNHSILQIGIVPDYCEALVYNNYKIKDITFIFPTKYTNLLDKVHNDIIHKINYYFNKNIYKINIINFDDTIDKIFDIELSNKKDLIIINNIFYEKGISNKDIEELQNFLLKIVEVVYAIKNLKENGNLIIVFNTMIFQQTSELYIWLKSHFKESYLYYPEISNKLKRSNLVAIFKGFKQPSTNELNKITKYMENIIKDYPNNVFDFNIIDKQQRKYYDITKEITNPMTLDVKPIKLLLNLNKNDARFNEIIEFNKNRYLEQLEFVNHYLNFNGDYHFPTQEQITASVLYCNKWGIEYFPYFESTKFLRDKMGQQILAEMYGEIKPINYVFNTKDKRIISNELEDIESAIFDVNNQIAQTGLMIDSRRDFTIPNESEQLVNYYKATTLFRYFKNDKYKLNTIVQNKIGRNISQAWLKFYEILAETDIIPRTNKKYRSFHLCEAPGSFIDCLDYYIKKETNIIDFNWNAQSYKAVKGKKYFGDDFGIIKAYPDHWKWGKDGTGDITKCDNILAYKEYCNDVDLITSDCGIPMFQPGYDRILFSSMVAITYLLPINGSIIFKILTPINKSIVWNIIYLWFTSFGEFRFFKPIQNAQSREFYIIGKRFKGINPETITKLMDLVKDEKDTFMNIDLFNGKYPISFVSQIKEISTQLVDNWSFTIQKQIYYNDNMEILENNQWFMNTIDKYIKKKNLDFINKYNLRKLTNKKKTYKKKTKKTSRKTKRQTRK